MLLLSYSSKSLYQLSLEMKIASEVRESAREARSSIVNWVSVFYEVPENGFRTEEGPAYRTCLVNILVVLLIDFDVHWCCSPYRASFSIPSPVSKRSWPSTIPFPNHIHKGKVKNLRDLSHTWKQRQCETQAGRQREASREMRYRSKAIIKRKHAEGRS